MPYYCELCKKEHANKYYKHLKYKRKHDKELDEAIKEIDDLVEKEPQAFINIHEIAGLNIRIELVEKKLELIEKILETWKIYLDRKHYYPNMYQEYFEELIKK